MTKWNGEALATLSLDSEATGKRVRAEAAVPPLLLDRFEVRSRLGAGGMGVVYEAWDRELGAPVALKFLHRSDSRALYRLKHEFRSMNAIGPHPNLIAPSGLFCDGGLWFVSMELVRGEPFLSFTRPGGELDLARLRSSLLQLAQGLGALHAHGKVHRDLKPSNVLVSGEGRLVILDFGLIRDRDVAAEPRAGSGASGTPSYMSPEQARGEPATEASDCYALGVMLYEALTGVLPLEAAASSAEPCVVFPSALARELPEELARLCLALLSREPMQRPGVDDVLAALGHPRSGTHPVERTARGLFVGRRDELAALRAALRRTDEGLPQLLLVEGESAVGKSALVEAFMAALPVGTVALRSRCHVRARVPFKAWDDLIDELGRFLGRAPEDDVRRWTPQDLDTLLQMFPVLGRVDALRAGRDPSPCPGDPHELRRRGAAALRELLGRIVADHRLVVFIDDLQWGDADSAMLLRELLCGAFAPAVLLLGAYRSEAVESSEFVRAVRALCDEEGLPLHLLRLEPLPEREARALAQALLGDRGDAQLAATIARESAGMPLFVRELSAQAREGLLGGLPQGTALAAAIARRVRTLSPPAQAVLELVSIAHAPLPEAVILSAAELGEQAPTVVRALGAQWLLRVRDDGRLDAYHDRVRETVADGIDPERKRALHGALAQALERSGRAAPDLLAAHALAAGMRDVGLSATLQAASQAMQKLAFERAAAHLRAALSLLADDDPRKDGALVQLAEALRADGRGREAGDVYAQAAERVEGLLRLERLRLASSMYLGCAYVDRGIEVMLPVLRELGLSFPRTTTGLLLATFRELAHVRLLQALHPERSEAAVAPSMLARIDACRVLAIGLLSVVEGGSALFLLRCLRLSLQAGAQGSAAYVEAIMASTPNGPAQLERRSRPVLERCLRIAERHGDKELEGMTHTCHAMAHLYALRPASAIEHAWAAKRCLAAAGMFGGIAMTAGEQALHFALMLTGRVNELAAATAEHGRRARARSDLYSWNSCRTFTTVALLAADQPGRALAELDDVLHGWSTGEHWQRWRRRSPAWLNALHVLMLRTWTLVYEDDGASALAAIRVAWPDFAAGPRIVRKGWLVTSGWRTIMAWTRGAAALAAAERAPARRRLLRDARRCERMLDRITVQPLAATFAHMLRAGRYAMAGKPTVAAAALARAANEFDAVGMQLFAAAARRRLGELTAGEPGRLLRDAADARMRELGVVAPERWTAMYAPGFSAVRPR